MRGEKEEAEKYNEWVLNRLDSPYIPEQIFENELQKSVCPLVWAHAMFVINLGFRKRYHHINKPTLAFLLLITSPVS